MNGMKDSGYKWLNKIPASWVTKPVYAIASVNKISFDPKTKPNATYCEFSMPAFDNGCKPVLVKGNAMESTRIILTKPVVLMNKLNVRKQRVWNIKEVPDGALCTSEFVPLEVKQGVSQDYVYWCLLNKSSTDNLDALSNGSSNSQIRVRPNDISHLRIALPPTVDEQQSVADYLTKKCSELARAAQLIDRQIGYLNRYRASVIHEAVTRGIDSTVPIKPSGVDWIGNIPTHWQAERISYHCKLESGHTPSKDHPEWWKDDECVIPWLTTGDVHRFRRGELISIDDTEEHISEVGLAHSSARILPAGTVALSRTASVGFSIIMGRDMATSQDFADWVPGPDVNSKYLLYVFRSMSQLFEQLKIGSTHKTIYMHVLKTLKMPLPPISEQLVIADYLDARTAAIDAVLDTKRKQLDILKRRRQSLIYEYVTGKRRVTEEA